MFLWVLVNDWFVSKFWYNLGIVEYKGIYEIESYRVFGVFNGILKKN